MRAELWLSLKYLLRNKRTHISFISVVACLGVALGVCSLIVVMAVMNGFDRNLKEKLLGFNFHVVAYLDKQNPDLIGRISKIDGVENVTLFSQVQTAVKNKDTVYPVILESMEFNPKEAKKWRTYLKQGNLDNLIIGKVLAENLGLIVGDELELFHSQDFKTEKFKVGGIFSFGMYDLDSNFIICPFSVSESFLKKSAPIYALGIETKDLSRAAWIKDKIISANPEGINMVRTWSELNESLFSALELEKLTMFVILSLIILVASFNIFATQTIKVVEKTRDIGILKAVGLSPHGVRLLFSLQGVILGLLGTLLGSGFGLSLCYLLEKYQFIKLSPKIYYVEYLPVAINYRDVGIVCLVALGMSIIFSLGPAIRASKVTETEALRYG